MKNLLRLTLVVLAFAFTATATNAQAASCDPASCDTKICTPAMCDLMVKLGICSPAQVAKCKAKSSDTKVASVVMERESEVASTEKPVAKTTSCDKSATADATCCASTKSVAKIE